MHLNKKQRPKISVYIALSIDGYIARKDDSLDWLDRVGGFDEDYGFQQMLTGIDALIIGRKTYEIASTVPDPYPGKRVIVLSNSLDSVKAGMELYKGDLAELAEKLYREGVKHIWVDGGSTISQFLDLQLVDEMTLSVIPIVLGSGLPLFHTIGKEIPCRLVSSQSYRSGLIQQHYEIIKQFNESQDKIHFKIVDYGTDEYKKAVALREEILCKPLGLFLTKDELEMEKEHVHIVGFLGQEMCATAVLVPDGDEMKMQRVALKTSFQGKGIGSALMHFCEEYANKHGFKSIYRHERIVEDIAEYGQALLLTSDGSEDRGEMLEQFKGMFEPNGVVDIALKTDIDFQAHLISSKKEKDAALDFRQKHFFDRLNIQDPYTWTLDKKDHLHWLLYDGDEVIGYAHVQMWPDHRAALRIIVIDEQRRGQGMGKCLMDHCEKKLKQLGVTLFQTEASPNAYLFYKKLGYTEMPFNNPDGEATHPDDRAMGKYL